MSSCTYLPPRQDQLTPLGDFLDHSTVDAYELRGPAGAVSVPPEVYDVLRAVVHAMAQGRAVTVTPHDTVLTTQQAAEILGVSRPTVIKFIDEGRLKADRVSSRRTIRLTDVLQFREIRRQEQYDAIAASAIDLDDEPDLDDILGAARAARKEVARTRRR